jgi:zinc/manganese transport system permease protein
MVSAAVIDNYLLNTVITATIVAVLGGAVGFFVVLRGSSFAAHAIPNGAFAGAAAAALAGINTLIGLAVAAVGAAVGLARLGHGRRQDVGTALGLVFLLAVGALLVSMSTEYEPALFGLLFGEVLGVSPAQVGPTVVLALVCLVALAASYRPLMLSSIAPDIAEARGVSPARMQLWFLLILALATSLTVPVVGALLIFSLMIGPAAAARVLCAHPVRALFVSVGLAVATVWTAIAAALATNWPVGFFVGIGAGAVYASAHTGAWLAARRARVRRDGRTNHPQEQRIAQSASEPH